MKLILKLIVIIIVGVSAVIFLAQKLFIYPGAYMKDDTAFNSPLADVEIIPLTTDDGINIQLFKIKSSRANTNKALLAFHGNADTASRMLFGLVSKGILEDGADIYALEYRGYIRNDGTPSEKGLALDAKAALKYLKENNYDQIVYYGHSLGTGVAINLCKEEIPFILMLESPFTSLADLASNFYPFIPKFVFNTLLTDKYNSMATLSEIEIPYLLIMHGEKDDIISSKQAEDLYNAANSPHKVIRLYENAGHNDIANYNTQDLQVFNSNVRTLEKRKNNVEN